MNIFIKAILKKLFYCLNAKKFKAFPKSSVFIKPDIITGHEFIQIGENVVFQSMAWLLALKQDNIEPKLIVEEGSIIGRFAHIVALRKVSIGKNVLMADKVYISDNIHEYKDITKPIMHQPILFKSEVEIGENSWIGENVSIIGAKIGKHCVIGANAVVSKDIPDYTIAVGSPAKVIKKFNHDTKEWEQLKDAK